MSDLESFESRFTTEQISLFAELIEKHWVRLDFESQDEKIAEILYRFEAVGLDKRWNGIPQEILSIFSKLKANLDSSEWNDVSRKLSEFREEYPAYKKSLIEAEERAREKAEKDARERKASEELAKEELRKKEEQLKATRRLQASEKAEAIRLQAKLESRNGRMAVPTEFDRNYADVILKECVELAITAITINKVEESIARILTLILDGNKSSRAIQVRLSARSKEAEIVIAFLFLGKANDFIAPLWRGRVINGRHVMDQLYAYNLAIQFTESKEQALIFSTYFPEPPDLESRVKIANVIYACIQDGEVTLEASLPTLVKFIPVEAMSEQILLSSLKMHYVGNWRTRFFRLLDLTDTEEHSPLIESLTGTSREYLDLAHDEYRAEKLDMFATQRLVDGNVQCGFGMKIEKISLAVKAEYIENLIKYGQVTNNLIRDYLYEDGVEKKSEIAEICLRFQDISLENFIGVAAILESCYSPQALLDALNTHEYPTDNEEIWQLRKRLLFATKNLDAVIVLDGDRKFVEQDDNLDFALLALQSGDYQACKQILEREFGKFNSILELDVIGQMATARKVEFLPYILKFEEISDPKVIIEVAKLEISEGRLLSAGEHLGKLVEAQNSDAAALMLKVKEPTGETPFEDLYLATQTSDFEMKVVAYRELSKHYAYVGDMESAQQYAEVFAPDDDESAYLLATIVKNSRTSYWAEEVLVRTSFEEQDSFRNRFITYGFSRDSELEDYNLHKNLITRNIKQSSQRSTSGAIRVTEDWYCRKALLNEYSDETSGPTSLSFNFSSCRIHDRALQERIKFGYRSPQSRQVDKTVLLNFKQDAEIRDFASKATPSMLKILSDLQASGFQPRKWQEKAFAEWVDHARQGMIEAVTGSGKSYLGALAAAEALDDGYAVLIVVPTQILCDQWIEGPLRALHRDGLVNKIGNAKSNAAPDASAVVPGKITVAVLKSIIDNPSYLPGSHLNSCLIADELHNYGGLETSKALGANFRRRLGMTATLADSESLGFFKNYFGGDPIYTYDFGDAVRDGAVSKFDLVMIGVRPNDLERELYTEAESQMRTAREEIIKSFSIGRDANSFERGLAALENAGRAKDLTDRYKLLKKRADSIISNSQSKLRAVNIISSFIGSRGNTIVFSDVNSNAKNVRQILANEGVLGEIVNSDVSPSERKLLIEKLENKSISALISPKALDEGVDIKVLTVGLFVGVQAQRRRLIQRLGRVLRVQSGKKKPVVIIPFNVGSSEDPTIPGNEKLQLGKFDFIGANADTIKSFQVGEEDSIKESLKLFL
ncbi:unannotated protein [freshwater metagenome]|uniref:Unannotated protein n=1 Tax=freshwater metagenome TaxID=449393 RepID=A0A6J6EDJ8_9ZZZZ